MAPAGQSSPESQPDEPRGVSAAVAVLAAVSTGGGTHSGTSPGSAAGARQRVLALGLPSPTALPAGLPKPLLVREHSGGTWGLSPPVCLQPRLQQRQSKLGREQELCKRRKEQLFVPQAPQSAEGVRLVWGAEESRAWYHWALPALPTRRQTRSPRGALK